MSCEHSNVCRRERKINVAHLTKEQLVVGVVSWLDHRFPLLHLAGSSFSCDLMLHDGAYPHRCGISPGVNQ